MIMFINSENTKFCQSTLRTKRFIHKRKVVPFFLPHGVEAAAEARESDGLSVGEIPLPVRHTPMDAAAHTNRRTDMSNTYLHHSSEFHSTK